LARRSWLLRLPVDRIRRLVLHAHPPLHLLADPAQVVRLLLQLARLTLQLDDLCALDLNQLLGELAVLDQAISHHLDLRAKLEDHEPDPHAGDDDREANLGDGTGGNIAPARPGHDNGRSLLRRRGPRHPRISRRAYRRRMSLPY